MICQDLQSSADSPCPHVQRLKNSRKQRPQRRTKGRVPFFPVMLPPQLIDCSSQFVSLRDELFRRHAAATVATRYDGVVARRYPRQTFTRVPNAASANAEMQSQVSADGNWSIDTQAAMAARRYAMMAIPSSQFLPHEQETLRVGATEMQRYEPAASHGYTATQSFPIPPMHMTFGPASAATSSYASGTSMSLAANNISFGSYF